VCENKGLVKTFVSRKIKVGGRGEWRTIDDVLCDLNRWPFTVMVVK